MENAKKIGIGVLIVIAVLIGIASAAYLVTSELNDEPEQANIQDQIDTQVEPTQTAKPVSASCTGTARCITGIITQIIDGDTLRIDEHSIRFALASTPELNELGGVEAKNFLKTICPIGSGATVDEDDGQTQGSYGRILGVVYCNGINLNSAILDSSLGKISTEFCSISEFADEIWAKKHGCISKQTILSTQSCHPSYPDFCIPHPPPDLDCKDVPQKRFTVLSPDPHNFDGDGDGIGCES